MTTNYKVTNTVTGAFLITDQKGFEGLVASHTANMGIVFAALTAQMMRADVLASGWKDETRGISIEQTNLPAQENPEVFNDEPAP